MNLFLHVVEAVGKADFVRRSYGPCLRFQMEWETRNVSLWVESVWNRRVHIMKTILGSKWVSKRASEQMSVAERMSEASSIKRTRERGKQTRERTSESPSTLCLYSLIIWLTVRFHFLSSISIWIRRKPSRSSGASAIFSGNFFSLSSYLFRFGTHESEIG